MDKLQMSSQENLPAKDVVRPYIERYSEKMGAGETLAAMLLRADNSVQNVPEFTEAHLEFFQALLTINATEAPVTGGFSQDDLYQYAQRIGNYNGLLAAYGYIVDTIETQLHNRNQR